MVSHGGVREWSRVSQKHLLKPSAKVVVCINVSDLGICVQMFFKHFRLKSVDHVLLLSPNKAFQCL